MKKMISFILTLVLALNICLYNESYYDAKAYNNSEELLDAITSVVDTYSDVNLVASEATDIYNKDNKIVGVSITVENDKGESYGYVNFDFEKENPLSDFMIYKDTEDLFEEIAGEEMESGDKIYKVDSFSYVVKDGNNYIAETNDEMSKKEFKKEYTASYGDGVSSATKYSSYKSIINEISSANFKTSKKISQYNSKKSCLSQKTFEQQVNRYACTVQALTEIAYQDGVINGSELGSTYNYIWKKTKTTTDHVSNNIAYGTTLDSNMKSGYIDFLNYHNRSSQITCKNNPGFSFFKQAVNYNDSSVINGRIQVINKDTGKAEEKGHSMSVLGYAIIEGKKNYNCLLIADGWNTSMKYINYDTVDFTSTYGMRIHMK